MTASDEYRTDLPPAGTKARNAFRARERVRRRGYGVLGTHDRVPAHAARHALRTLRDAGFTYDRISEIVGIDTKQICDYLKPETKNVQKHTHDRIAALDIEMIVLSEPRGRRLDKAPYRKLLRSYLAAGWSRAEMSKIAGPPLTENSDIWRDRGKYVSVEMVDAVLKMHAELGEKVKTELRNRDKARMTVLRSRGYKVPAAYDWPS